MLKSYPKYLFIVFLFFATLLFGTDSSNWKTSPEEKQLSFSLSGNSFLKNNEYYGSFTRGYTGIGIFIKPVFIYGLTCNTDLNIGYFLLKYSGLDSFSKKVPVLALNHRFNERLSFTMGNISGGDRHRLEEILYKKERSYEDFIEYGMQFVRDSKFVYTDLWVDWYQYILEDDPFQEKFVVGVSSEFKQVLQNRSKIFIPVHALFYHQGGQIDMSDKAVNNIINLMWGIGTKLPLSLHHSITPEILIFTSYAKNPIIHVSGIEFTNGSGIFSKINYDIHNIFMFTLGYWKADTFFAPRGEFLFHSISDFDPEFFQKKRSVIVNQFLIKKISKNKKVKLDIFIDTYYDTDNSNMDISFGLYIRFRDSIFLKNFKL